MSTPKLRFKEFKDDWSMRHLNEVLTLVSRPIEMDDNSPYSLVTVKRRYEGIVPRGIFLGKDVKVKSQFLIKKNDFLISKRQISHNSCGVVPEALDGSIVSNEYSVFVPARNNDVFFFNYFCNRPQLSRTFFLSSIGVHIEKMLFKVDDWLKWKFYFPSLPEQQKIASFLSAVDEKIQQLTRKKELLEQYKKGAMQQLFAPPSSSELGLEGLKDDRINPSIQKSYKSKFRQLRFKDANGKPYPKWEEKRLGDVSSFLDGKRKPIKSEDRSKMKGIYPYYGASGIIDYVNEYIFDEDIILLGEDGENIVSRNLPLAFKVSVKCWVNNHAHVIKPNEGINIDFLTYSLERIDYVKYNTGTAQPKLNQEVCKNIPLFLPVFEEQQKIASFLTALDAKIESINRQIAQTQTFKKGLLQQMFV